MDEIKDIVKNEQLSAEVLFTILAHERRRYALYCLETYQTPMALADLADEVARLEYDNYPTSQIPDEKPKKIYLDLYHSHIPKMVDANIVKYDQKKNTVCSINDLSGLNLSDMI